MIAWLKLKYLEYKQGEYEAKIGFLDSQIIGFPQAKKMKLYLKRLAKVDLKIKVLEASYEHKIRKR